MLGTLIAIVCLAVPVAASAQDATDPCYVDPTAAECFGVGGADDGQTADDGRELDVAVRGETFGIGGAQPPGATGALAVTGADIGVLVALVALLLGVGSLLVLRRRGRA